MPFVGFPFIFLVQESHLAWKEVFLELRFQHPTCMKVLLVACVIENRGKRSMDPMSTSCSLGSSRSMITSEIKSECEKCLR